MRDEIKRAFGAVQADAALREGTKEFLAQRLYRRPARRLRPAPLLACLALLAVACEESNADYRDVVYITGTQQKNTIRKGFEGNDCVELSLTCTAKVTEEIKGTFEAAPELLTAYNEANNADYVLPPTNAYSIEDAQVAIRPGHFVSTVAKLMIADPTQA